MQEYGRGSRSVAVVGNRDCGVRADQGDLIGERAMRHDNAERLRGGIPAQRGQRDDESGQHAADNGFPVHEKTLAPAGGQGQCQSDSHTVCADLRPSAGNGACR